MESLFDAYREDHFKCNDVPSQVHGAIKKTPKINQCPTSMVPPPSSCPSCNSERNGKVTGNYDGINNDPPCDCSCGDCHPPNPALSTVAYSAIGGASDGHANCACVIESSSTCRVEAAASTATCTCSDGGGMSPAGTAHDSIATAAASSTAASSSVASSIVAVMASNSGVDVEAICYGDNDDAAVALAAPAIAVPLGPSAGTCTAIDGITIDFAFGNNSEMGLADGTFVANVFAADFSDGDGDDDEADEAVNPLNTLPPSAHQQHAPPPPPPSTMRANHRYEGMALPASLRTPLPAPPPNADGASSLHFVVSAPPPLRPKKPAPEGIAVACYQSQSQHHHYSDTSKCNDGDDNFVGSDGVCDNGNCGTTPMLIFNRRPLARIIASAAAENVACETLKASSSPAGGDGEWPSDGQNVSPSPEAAHPRDDDSPIAACGTATAALTDASPLLLQLATVNDASAAIGQSPPFIHLSHPSHSPPVDRTYFSHHPSSEYMSPPTSSATSAAATCGSGAYGWAIPRHPSSPSPIATDNNSCSLARHSESSARNDNTDCAEVGVVDALEKHCLSDHNQRRRHFLEFGEEEIGSPLPPPSQRSAAVRPSPPMYPPPSVSPSPSPAINQQHITVLATSSASTEGKQRSQPRFRVPPPLTVDHLLQKKCESDFNEGVKEKSAADTAVNAAAAAPPLDASASAFSLSAAGDTVGDFVAGNGSDNDDVGASSSVAVSKRPSDEAIANHKPQRTSARGDASCDGATKEGRPLPIFSQQQSTADGGSPQPLVPSLYMCDANRSPSLNLGLGMVGGIVPANSIPTSDAVPPKAPTPHPMPRRYPPQYYSSRSRDMCHPSPPHTSCSFHAEDRPAGGDVESKNVDTHDGNLTDAHRHTCNDQLKLSTHSRCAAGRESHSSAATSRNHALLATGGGGSNKSGPLVASTSIVEEIECEDSDGDDCYYTEGVEAYRNDDGVFDKADGSETDADCGASEAAADREVDILPHHHSSPLRMETEPALAHNSKCNQHSVDQSSESVYGPLAAAVVCASQTATICAAGGTVAIRVASLQQPQPSSVTGGDNMFMRGDGDGCDRDYNEEEQPEDDSAVGLDLSYPPVRHPAALARINTREMAAIGAPSPSAANLQVLLLSDGGPSFSPSHNNVHVHNVPQRLPDPDVDPQSAGDRFLRLVGCVHHAEAKSNSAAADGGRGGSEEGSGTSGPLVAARSEEYASDEAAKVSHDDGEMHNNDCKVGRHEGKVSSSNREERAIHHHHQKAKEVRNKNLMLSLSAAPLFHSLSIPSHEASKRRGGAAFFGMASLSASAGGDIIPRNGDVDEDEDDGEDEEVWSSHSGGEFDGKEELASLSGGLYPFPAPLHHHDDFGTRDGPLALCGSASDSFEAIATAAESPTAITEQQSPLVYQLSPQHRPPPPCSLPLESETDGDRTCERGEAECEGRPQQAPAINACDSSSSYGSSVASDRGGVEVIEQQHGFATSAPFQHFPHPHHVPHPPAAANSFFSTSSSSTSTTSGRPSDSFGNPNDNSASFVPKSPAHNDAGCDSNSSGNGCAEASANNDNTNENDATHSGFFYARTYSHSHSCNPNNAPPFFSLFGLGGTTTSALALTINSEAVLNQSAEGSNDEGPRSGTFGSSSVVTPSSAATSPQPNAPLRVPVLSSPSALPSPQRQQLDGRLPAGQLSLSPPRRHTVAAVGGGNHFKASASQHVATTDVAPLFDSNGDGESGKRAVSHQKGGESTRRHTLAASVNTTQAEGNSPLAPPLAQFAAHALASSCNGSSQQQQQHVCSTAVVPFSASASPQSNVSLVTPASTSHNPSPSTSTGAIPRHHLLRYCREIAPHTTAATTVGDRGIAALRRRAKVTSTIAGAGAFYLEYHPSVPIPNNSSEEEEKEVGGEGGTTKATGERGHGHEEAAERDAAPQSVASTVCSYYSHANVSCQHACSDLTTCAGDNTHGLVRNKNKACSNPPSPCAHSRLSVVTTTTTTTSFSPSRHTDPLCRSPSTTSASAAAASAHNNRYVDRETWKRLLVETPTRTSGSVGSEEDPHRSIFPTTTAPFVGDSVGEKFVGLDSRSRQPTTADDGASAHEQSTLMGGGVSSRLHLVDVPDAGMPSHLIGTLAPGEI